MYLSVKLKILCSTIVRGFSLYFKYLGRLFEVLSCIVVMAYRYMQNVKYM